MPFHLAQIGTGRFGTCFVPLFANHPNVSRLTLFEARPERAAGLARTWGAHTATGGFDEALASDADAVAIMTPRWEHGPQAVRALRAGKHVFSAVPACTSVDEMREIVRAVEETGLTYMTAETSYYYAATVYARKKWEEGAYGDFVYGEGEYQHDMSHGFYDAFQHSGGENWKDDAAFPPMLYPTHSTSMVLSITGARATDVSCLGWTDTADDGVFNGPGNRWGNAFSNQSALMRTSDGGMMRINEFRRIGVTRTRSVWLNLRGTLGAFEEGIERASFVTLDGTLEDATAATACAQPSEEELAATGVEDEVLRRDFAVGFAPAHAEEAERLPASFDGLPNGHEGSHQFLVDDFCVAVENGTLPPCHAWAAARWVLPGMIAHESSRRGGERLPIPDLGWPE